MHLGLDPGVTSGYAMSDNTGRLLDYGQLGKNELFDFLQDIRPYVIVVENFKIRPGHNFNWNGMEVIRVIGAIEYRAHELGVPLVFQEPSVKSVGYKWAGMPPPKSHAQSHQTDAWAHLVFYNSKILGLPIPAQRLLQSSHEHKPDSPQDAPEHTQATPDADSQARHPSSRRQGHQDHAEGR
jgi:hypothetical protein